MNDSEITALLYDRDENAVSAVSSKYGGLCRSIMMNILADSRDVEECLNSLYMKLWSSIPPAKPQNLKAYIAKAARNEALSRLREERKAPAELLAFEELEGVLPSVESEAEKRELANAISRFLNEQPKEKRLVFMRRYWYFDSVKAIAERFGMSEAKVSSMLMRLRKALRKALEREELL